MSRVTRLNPLATQWDALAQGAVFSTIKYPQGAGGDDRVRVQAAVDAAVAAIEATGESQTVLIHAPMAFETGSVLPAAGTGDFNRPYQGVQLPVWLPAVLRIEFAAGAKIWLSEACRTAFSIRKIADYDVFQNVHFVDPRVDGNDIPVPGLYHGLIGNITGNAVQLYLSFHNIKVFGKADFNFWSDGGTQGAGNDFDSGQLAIALYGAHSGPMEDTHTFATDIYLEDGYQTGGRGLFNVCAVGTKPGGVSHYHNDIVVDRWGFVPGTGIRTNWGYHTGVFVCGPGYGDYAYIGPGYSEGCGDDCIEVGPMQNLVIEGLRAKNPWLAGILLRSTHAPINIATQKMTLRGMQCEVTAEQTSTPDNLSLPIMIRVDHQVIQLTSTATGGNGTLTVPVVLNRYGPGQNSGGTTASIPHNATTSQVVAALAAIGCPNSRAIGGPLGTAPMTVWVDCGWIETPVAYNSSLTGGSMDLKLSDQNASIGSIIIEDLSVKIEGLTSSKMPVSARKSAIINGLEYPIKRIELIRPKIELKDVTYDSTGILDLNLYHPSAQFNGWNDFSIRDHKLAFTGTCHLENGLGNFWNFQEIVPGGIGTLVDIDGQASDRAATGGTGQVAMLAAAAYDGTNLRIKAKNVVAKSMASTGAHTYIGFQILGNGTVAQFDYSDCDFSAGCGVGKAVVLTNAQAASKAVVKPGGVNRYNGSSDFNGRTLLPLVTTTMTVDVRGDYILRIGSGGAPTLTSAVGCGGRQVRVKNDHNSDRTFYAASGETIDGDASYVLGPKDAVLLISNDANWEVF